MTAKTPWYDTNLWLIVWLICCPPIAWYGIWKNTTFTKNVKIIIVVVSLILTPSAVSQSIGSGSTPQQTQEQPAGDTQPAQP